MTKITHYPPVTTPVIEITDGNIQIKNWDIPTESDFPTPPVAYRKPESFYHFNQSRTDNYYWMKDRSNPLTIPYLKAENDYAEMVMESTGKFQDKIYNELKQRINEEEQSAPVYNNGYYYYSRTEKGKQYKIYCRKKKSLAAAEEIIFDVNLMAESKSTFLFGDFEISPDNQYAAYLSNETGSYAEFILKVRDLETDSDVPGFEITKVQDVAWANDSKVLFYTVCNSTLRPWRVYRQEFLSALPGKLVFEEQDELFIVNLQKTKTNEFIFISSSSFTTTEYRMVNANKPFNDFEVFMPRAKDVDYGVYHHHNHFYIQYKDRQNLNGKLFRVAVDEYSDRNKWEEIISHCDSTFIDYIDVYHDFLAVQLRKNGVTEIRVIGIRCEYSKTIKFPESVYSVEVIPLPDYQSKKLRYSYVSLNRPLTVYEYEPIEAISEVIKDTEIPGGFNPDDYTVEQIFATSSDGVKIPISLLYKNELMKNGNNPAFLYSYGAYGVPSDVKFVSSFYSLVNRGFVFAMARVRGGSDLGEQWYEEGKLLNKKNSFNDFIACAEKLIEDKYTAPSKLSIMGASAGGLLVTAVTNMRPDLFHTVVAVVPFVDVINTMLDPTMPLTVQEYEEWGNPNIKEYYEYMLSYSPYDNIGAFNYPNILVTAGLNDSQVGFHEPAKYVAKLREYKSSDNIILLRTNMESGHGGATGRFEQLKEIAFELAFILERQGIID